MSEPTQSAPREFYVRLAEKSPMRHFVRTCWFEGYTHKVIEKSAYDALAVELYETKIKLDQEKFSHQNAFNHWQKAADELAEAKREFRLERQRMNYVMSFLKDCIDEIECRGDEDCDHCVVKAMIQDQAALTGGEQSK